MKRLRYPNETLMSTVIRKKQTFRRRRPREPLVDGTVDTAEAVTHTRIAELQDDGTTIIKHVLESLDDPPSSSTHQQMQIDPPAPHDDFHNDLMQNMSPPQTPRPKKSRVSENLN